MITENGPIYTDYELKLELSNVFKSVYFVDKRAKHKLQDSYFLNFYNLVNYARENKIDEMAYIRSVRNVLLKHPQTYEAR